MTYLVLERFICKIAIAVAAVPVFLAALVHAGGGNCLAVYVLFMSAGSGIEVCDHINTYIIVVGVCITCFGIFSRFIAQSKHIICACIFQIKHAVYPLIRIAHPIDVAIIEVAGTVTVCVPQRTAIAVSIIEAVITNTAFKPSLTFGLEGDAQSKQHITVNVHIGARAHLILHSTNIYVIRNTGKAVGLCIVVLGNVNGEHRINFFKFCVARIAESVIAVALLYNVKKGCSVLLLQIILGVNTVHFSIGTYINGGFLIVKIILGICKYRHRHHTDQHCQHQEQCQNSFRFHKISPFSF